MQSISTRRIGPALLRAAAVLLPLFGTPASASLNAGTSVPAALEQLRARGLRILYSSDLVDPSMRVMDAARGSESAAAAREILAPHGLGLRHLEGDLYTVVRVGRGWRTTIAGRIVDPLRNKPIGSARVEVIGAGKVSWTAADGGFSIRDVNAGRHALQVSAEGYESTAINLTTPAPSSTPLTIALQSRHVDIDEVTVTASRYVYAASIEASTFALGREEIRTQPSIGEDALQSVARLPGFAFSGISARPNVRGGEDSETLVLLDHMPLRQPFHMPAYNGVFSVLDEDLITRIDAFTGVYPARYGNRMSGVLELESRAFAEAPARALGLSVFNAKALWGDHAQRGDFDWLAAGRIGTLRPLLNAFAPDVGNPSYGDIFAKGAWRTGPSTQWQAHVLSAHDELTYSDVNTGEAAELASRSSYAWLTATHALRDDLSWETLLGFSRIDSTRSGVVTGDLTIDGEISDKRTSRLLDLRTSLYWQPGEHHSLELGLNGTRGDARYDYASEVEYDPIAGVLFGRPEEIERRSRINVNRVSLAAYLSDRWQLGDRLFVELGARLEHESGSRSDQHTTFSPRISVRMDFTPRTRLRASWARISQSDEVHELQVGDGIETFQPVQHTEQYVVGFEHRFDSGAALRLEAFKKVLEKPRARFENVFDPLRFLAELSADRIRVAPTQSTLRGIELSGQWEQGPWTLWSAYTWSEYSDRIAGRKVLRSWDQTHTGTLAVTWRRGPWNLSTLGLFRSGRPATRIVAFDTEDPQLGPRNATRRGSFASVDMRMTREFTLQRSRLVAFAQVTNVFNRANPCCADIDLENPESDEALLLLQSEQQSAYPTLPALGVTWEF